MKVKEAKTIIGNIINWQMVLMGVVSREEMKINESIDMKSYSLQQLIDANIKVKECNKKISPSKGKFSMTCDDRIIAAIYTCLHYEVNHKISALINDKVCQVFKADYN